MNHKYVSLLQLILAQDTYDNAWRKKKTTIHQTKQLQRPKLKLLAGRMCAQQILNVGMKTSQTISMGTHMLPKKG